MLRQAIGARDVWSFAGTLCCAVVFGIACGSPVTEGDEMDGSVVLSDASAGEDANLPASSDAGSMDGPLDGAVTTDGGSAAVPDAGSVVRADAGAGPDPRFEAEMAYVTANIGRGYDTQSDVAAVFDHVGDVIGPGSGPKFIGWQEIGEGDPCGPNCEIEALRDRFKTEWGWETLRPLGTRPDGGTERVKDPVTSKGSGGATSVRAVFASPGWAGVSPTRFVTVAHYAERNISVLDTHFIAGAWSCRSNVERRRDYWRRAWAVLQSQVAIEHDRGRNVIVTGDLNRPRATNDCNPAWDPTSLHASARVIGGAGIDYIFAVPAAGWRFAYSRRADGSVKRGAIPLGLDGHQAHWVAGQFQRR